MVRIIIVLLLVVLGHECISQRSEGVTTNLAGVYQGRTLFIQNPYNRQSRSFCIDRIFVNNEPLILNYKLSAIKLDFENFDLYTPVNIEIVHADSVCSPIIINSEAILFHTIFRFSSIALSDSSLTWTTKGERGIGSFEIEKLDNGIWLDMEVVQAEGTYEGATYSYFPELGEGANKYRVKYIFPRGSRSTYLYSMEVDYDHYPEPVEFRPQSAKTRLFLSRHSPYEIYDANNDLVLSGSGIEIDVRVLRRGQYVIYFDGKDPGSFQKE